MTKKVAIRKRLLLTMLAGSLGAWLLGAILNRVDIPGVDTALQWLPFAVALTVFAVGGFANAMNIIDGYNGLAGFQSRRSMAPARALAAFTGSSRPQYGLRNGSRVARVRHARQQQADGQAPHHVVRENVISTPPP